MRAVWYEATGAAEAVLRHGVLDDPQPGPGEVRVRIRASGVNPSDVKARSGARGAMPFARVIPHSDGAGEIDAIAVSTRHDSTPGYGCGTRHGSAPAVLARNMSVCLRTRR